MEGTGCCIPNARPEMASTCNPWLILDIYRFIGHFNIMSYIFKCSKHYYTSFTLVKTISKQTNFRRRQVWLYCVAFTPRPARSWGDICWVTQSPSRHWLRSYRRWDGDRALWESKVEKTEKMEVLTGENNHKQWIFSHSLR
jgi:hypothetical protein